MSIYARILYNKGLILCATYILCARNPRCGFFGVIFIESILLHEKNSLLCHNILCLMNTLSSSITLTTYAFSWIDKSLSNLINWHMFSLELMTFLNVSSSLNYAISYSFIWDMMNNLISGSLWIFIISLNFLPNYLLRTMRVGYETLFVKKNLIDMFLDHRSLRISNLMFPISSFTTSLILKSYMYFSNLYPNGNFLNYNISMLTRNICIFFLVT